MADRALLEMVKLIANEGGIMRNDVILKGAVVAVNNSAAIKANSLLNRRLADANIIVSALCTAILMY